MLVYFECGSKRDFYVTASFVTLQYFLQYICFVLVKKNMDIFQSLIRFKMISDTYMCLGDCKTTHILLKYQKYFFSFDNW